MDTQNRKKEVFSITEKKMSDGNNKSFFTRVGVAFTNSDGSTTIRLDALPVGGVLQVRDERPDRYAGRTNESAPATSVRTPPPSDLFGGS